MTDKPSAGRLQRWAHSVLTVLAAVAASYVFFGEFKDRLDEDLSSRIDSSVEDSLHEEWQRIDAALEEINAKRREAEEKLTELSTLGESFGDDLKRVEAELRARVDEAVAQVGSRQAMDELLEAARVQVRRDVESAVEEFRKDVQAMLERLEEEIPLVARAQHEAAFYDGLAADEAYREQYFRWLLAPGEQVPYALHTVQLPSGQFLEMGKWHDPVRGPSARRLTYQEILGCRVLEDFEVFRITATGGLSQHDCQNDRPPLQADEEMMRTLFAQLPHLLPRWKELGVVH